jgi:hypothetical protein
MAFCSADALTVIFFCGADDEASTATAAFACCEAGLAAWLGIFFAACDATC